MVEPQFHDIYGMIYVPWWQSRWCYYVLLCIVSAILCWIIRYFWRWYKIKKIMMPIPDRCMHELKNMQYMISLGSLDYGVGYITMGHLLREYITYRYNVCCLHKTDIELKEQIKTLGLPNELIELLEDFFDRAYKIKFAGAVVDSKMISSDIILFIDMIKKTRNVVS